MYKSHPNSLVFSPRVYASLVRRKFSGYRSSLHCCETLTSLSLLVMATNPNMNLDDEEGTTVPLQRETPTNTPLNENLGLVGRFLTRKPTRTLIMKDRLAAIWQPGRGVSIRALDSNLFLFQFFHSRNLKKVFSGGPWYFDGHMMILSRLEVGDVPTQVSLFHAAFWVQVHDVPIGFNDGICWARSWEFYWRILGV